MKFVCIVILVTSVLSTLSSSFAVDVSAEFIRAWENRIANHKSEMACKRIIWRDSCMDLNPDFVADGIDFSCASPWNKAHGSMMPGTAITRKHVVMAKHWDFSTPLTMCFIDKGGKIYERLVIDKAYVQDTDICIGLLDRDLPESIHPARLLPINYKEFLGSGVNLPIAILDKDERLVLRNCMGLWNKRAGDYSTIIANQQVPSELRCYMSALGAGHSGSPAFLIMPSGDAVLLFCIRGSGATATGPALHYYAKEIQQVIDSLTPGYELSFYSSRSEFISYGNNLSM